MRIAQITDIHINKIDELTNNINTQSHFLSIIEAVCEYHVDLIVLTGDLCHKSGDKAIYQWYKSVMDATGIDYEVIPGNHDDSTLMAEIFDYMIQNNELYFHKNIHGFNLIFLDSSQASMSDRQYHWLERQLTDNSLIFMHHPPCISGVSHMDKSYAFTQIERFQGCIKHQTNIFCGHCHTERSINIGLLNIFITPSCFLQISDKQEEFAIEHTMPAFRVIDLQKNGMLTAVKYPLIG